MTSPCIFEINDLDISRDLKMATEKAIFGAGCFWGVESAFRAVEGVSEAICGYSGGHLKNPTYHDVCSGETGHAEVVQVEYDPSRVSYEDLLDVFWNCHNPTTRNRQGPDIGTQYRSAIFFYTPEQEAAAKASREKLQQSGRWRDPVVTEISPAREFYRAEEYHQRYFEKHGMAAHCHT
jgi:peptide-methionine (S)-S-oxide reductase